MFKLLVLITVINEDKTKSVRLKLSDQFWTVTLL